MKPTKGEAAEALATLEAFLQNILKENSSWCASASIRLLKQLTKTIKPLIIDPRNNDQ